MVTLYEKLCYLCKQKGVSGGKMCADLGLSRSVMSDLKSGRKKGFSAEIAQKIASYFGVSVGYLLGEEKEKKETTILNTKSNIVVLENAKVKMIPLFESVSAGFGANALEEIQGYIPCYFENDYEAENSMCIKVWGDSMSPKIENRDIIQVVKQTSVDNGSIAVVLIDGEEGLVKRVVYGKTWIELHSINPAYPVQRFENEDVLRVSVVGLVRKIIKDV